MKDIRTRSLPAIRLALVIAVGFLSGCEKQEAEPQSAAVAAANQPAPAAPASPAFDKLPGKWLRPDGGYILEIRTVAPDGKMDAAYFNPKSINVAKAAALRDRGSVKVFIELRDVNYPGSTYTLAYDPTDDQLKGDYFQAALKQNFDVYFTRVQP